MATSTIATVRTQLTADFTAAGLDAYAYPPGDASVTRRFVYLETVEGDQEHLTFGGSRTERLQVSGVVHCEEVGSDQSVAAAAETAALNILAELEDALRTDDDLADTVFHAELVGYTSQPLLADHSRIHQIQFTVAVEAHI